MTGLSELAARVEAAEGPDRELDALIEVQRRRLAAYAAGLNDGNRAQWQASANGGVHDAHTVYTAPRSTASLDAAMQLAGDDPYGVLFEAMHRCPGSETDAAAFLRALPRYVTAAALRARASGQGEG